MKKYFGFAIADGMFEGDCSIRRRKLTVEQVREAVTAGVEPCLNPSHAATIAAMTSRFGISMPIPEKPPQVKLGVGDAVIVMGVRGLPRMTDRHEYNEEEIAAATFEFSEYTVTG